MTRDEIGKMRAESPRDFDAAVAEKVMGWGWTAWNKVRALRPPDWFGGEDGWPRAKGDEPLCVRWFNMLNAYTVNPAADYSVLKLVRETWTERQQKQMADELDRIYETRNEFALLAYRPGDHAEAALRVVTADAEGGK